MSKKIIALVLFYAVIWACTEEPSEEKETDQIPPVITIVSPADNIEFTPGDNVTLEVTATDNSGINFIRFYINGEEYYYDNTPPYSYEWDTKDLDLGIYNIKIEACDIFDNISQKSMSISLVPPTYTLAINGKIMDRTTNQAIANTTIELSSESTETDLNGLFSINKNVTDGNYVLSTNQTDSYMSTRYGIDVTENTTKNLDLYLYPTPENLNKKGNDFIKGVSLFDGGPWMGQDLYPDGFVANFERLQKNNCNVITVFDPVFVTAVGDDTVKMSTSANTDFEWNMLTGSQYQVLSSEANNKGLDLMYWFGVWPQSEVELSGKSFNETVFSGQKLSDAFWEDWFSEYTRILVDYAEEAARQGVPYISLGHGLNYATSPAQFSSVDLYHTSWTNMIEAIRDVYNGEIIYFGTNRHFTALNYDGGTEIEYYEDAGYSDTFIELFDAFGIIISNVTEKENPTPTDVKTEVQTILERYRNFNKPVILWIWTPSADGGANRYGHLEPVLAVNNVAYNFNTDFYEQADVYEGIMQAVNETDINVKGVISHGYMYFDRFEKYEPRDMETAFDKSASIRNKPAEGILKYWFGQW